MTDSRDTEIKDFLGENKESLTSLAILGTLIALLANLSVTWISYLLSFFMTASFVFVWSEIKLKSSQTDDLKLMFLKWFFRFSFWLIVVYILLKFRILSWVFLFIPIAISLLYWTIQLLRKSNTIMRLFRSEKSVYKIISFAVVGMLVILTMLLAWPISIPLNQGLDQLDHLNSKINLY